MVLRIAVMMLSSGHEVIGTILTPETELYNEIVEFPQAIRWWRDKEQGQCYEFVPYTYGGNLQARVPISKAHIVTMVTANEDVAKAYRGVIDAVSDHAERMAGLRRQMEESDSLGIEVKAKK